jgi:hypothetical protein
MMAKAGTKNKGPKMPSDKLRKKQNNDLVVTKKRKKPKKKR